MKQFMILFVRNWGFPAVFEDNRFLFRPPTFIFSRKRADNEVGAAVADKHGLLIFGTGTLTEVSQDINKYNVRGLFFCFEFRFMEEKSSEQNNLDRMTVVLIFAFSGF